MSAPSLGASVHRPRYYRENHRGHHRPDAATTVAIGLSGAVTDEFVELIRCDGPPFRGSNVARWILKDMAPVLRCEEAGVAMAGPGVNLVVFHKAQAYQFVFSDFVKYDA